MQVSPPDLNLKIVIPSEVVFAESRDGANRRIARAALLKNAVRTNRALASFP
jgi:hypothetical protein